MHNITDFHLRLKEQTKSYHDTLEELYLTKNLVDKTITKDEYITYLNGLLCLHESVESQLLRFSWEDIRIEIKSYLRKELLQKDLLVLGDKSDLKGCEGIELKSFNEALGFLYVLTGSTMGGKILAQKVLEIPALESANNYFNAFGEQTMMLWGDFMQKFTRYVEQNSVQDEVMEGAKNCYLYVKECLDG